MQIEPFYNYSQLSEWIASKKNPILVKWLLISIPIVMGISMLSYLIIWIITRYLRKKALQANLDKKDLPIINQINEQFNQMDARVLTLFHNAYHFNDIKWIASTIKINGFKNILLIGKYLETPLLLLQGNLKIQIDVFKNTLNVKKWNQKVKEYPELFSMPVNLVEQKNDKKYDLIIDLSTTDNYEDYKNYYPMLNNDGLLMIKQSLIFDKNNLRILEKELQNQNIKYEISFAHSKFLYIVKKINE
ncbi:MAG: BC85_0335 family putative methyltransferase [Metamycoplasmataceae bacterium]|uniref:BC85_0335 family putative methyltransferase n=1 Tax=Mycoplasmopsis lipophila TaxID=2117 RepID=UPI0038739857